MSYFVPLEMCKTRENFLSHLNRLYQGFEESSVSLKEDRFVIGSSCRAWFQSKKKVVSACEKFFRLNSIHLAAFCLEHSHLLWRWKLLPILKGSPLVKHISDQVESIYDRELKGLSDAVKVQYLRIALKRWEKKYEPAGDFQIYSSDGETVSFSSQRLTQQFPCLFSPESVSCMNGLESDDKHSFDATDFPFATEHVLYQFRYYLRHQVLPAVFDPLFLYQWADFLMYEDLVKELAPFVQ